MTSAGYRTLDFTETFLQLFASRDFTAADRKAILKGLRLLDTNERHPSLRVHELKGDREGSWSTSASVRTGAAIVAMPNSRDPASMERSKYSAWGATSELNIVAERASFGATSFSNPNHLPPIEGSKFVNPMTLPPGRARLATKPRSTGAVICVNTIGSV